MRSGRPSRSRALRVAWRVAWLMAAFLAPPAHAAACGETLPQPGRAVIAADGLHLAHAPTLWPLPPDRPFALEIALCDAATGAPAAVALLQVDADMPAHRHGLNYRVALQQTGPGRYRAEGLLLHMPGRWRLLFDLGPAQAPRRLVRVVDVD